MASASYQGTGTSTPTTGLYACHLCESCMPGHRPLDLPVIEHLYSYSELLSPATPPLLERTLVLPVWCAHLWCSHHKCSAHTFLHLWRPHLISIAPPSSPPVLLPYPYYLPLTFVSPPSTPHLCCSPPTMLHLWCSPQASCKHGGTRACVFHARSSCSLATHAWLCLCLATLPFPATPWPDPVLQCTRSRYPHGFCLC